jgi:hypothetical protein
LRKNRRKRIEGLWSVQISQSSLSSVINYREERGEKGGQDLWRK